MNPTDRRFLGELARRDGVWHAPAAEVAEACSLSVRGLFDVVARLEASGVIVVERSAGRGRWCSYRLADASSVPVP